jgi:hypothetical protein
MRNLLSISGKIGMGKDTVASIIQYLTAQKYKNVDCSFEEFRGTTLEMLSPYSNKKMAGKLKQIASILTGIPVNKFEDQEFKKTIMNEQWWFWEETSSYSTSYCKRYPYSKYKTAPSFPHCALIKTTHRQFLQLLGTDAIRNGLHEDTWLNAFWVDIDPFLNRQYTLKEKENKIFFTKPVLIDTTVIKKQQKTLFKCFCGKEFTSTIWRVETGHTKSCSCLQKQTVSKLNTKHGDSTTRLNSIYKNMKTRCYNKNTDVYLSYGAKGVTICDEWLTSYSNFKNWAIANGYDDNKTIDRKNNLEGYSSTNCRWILAKEQSKNKDTYKNNTSGYRGVSFKKELNKYVAQIQNEGKKKMLGVFDTAEEASKMYEQEREKLFKIQSSSFKGFIISDCRYINEYNSIKERGGLMIKVERPGIETQNHASETGLDSITDWDYVIQNNGTIDELIEKVREILIKENII